MTEWKAKVLGEQVRESDGSLDLAPWDGEPIVVRLHCSEFTSRCPVTGQPDFARLVVEYVPDAHLVETKSWKLYLQRYRERAEFNERLVLAIARDVLAQGKVRAVRVVGRFGARGGISVEAVCTLGEPEAQARFACASASIA